MPAFEALRKGEQCGEARRARAFDDRLFDFEQHDDRLFEHALADQHDVIDKLAHDGQRQDARRLDGNAFGDRIAAELRGFAPHRAIHRRVAFGLHADHFDGGLDALRGGCDAGNQAAAADRHDQGFELRPGSQHLEPKRALAGNNFFIVVRMHHRQPARCGYGQCVRLRSVEVLAVQDHFGAVAARALDLNRRREARHHDNGRDPESVCMVGHPLRMIARRRGYYAGRALPGRQRQ